jgi:predicted esterase
VVPRNLPADHPPTLFLHGEQDVVVPIGTMRDYADELQDQGIDVRVVTDPSEGHAWLPAAPTELRDWFLAHP